LRAPGDEKSAPANVEETLTMLMSDFLKGCVKAEELEPGSSATARIIAVDSREFEEGKKGVLFLDIFSDRGLVLNQTNLKALMAAFGANSENWVGQEVVVNRTLADFKGKAGSGDPPRGGSPSRRHRAGGRADAKARRGPGSARRDAVVYHRDS
jgi:hypothetical protein